jgi:hypothetical protein
MPKFTKLFTLLFLTGMLLSSCQKDINKYSKISLSKWKPTVSVPFAKSTVTFRDIIGNDTSIVSNTDSSLIYVYRKDSVVTIHADSLLQFSPNFSKQYTYSLGAIHFDEVSTAATAELSDVLPFIDAQTADTLKKHNHTHYYFPPFYMKSAYSLTAPPLNNFSSLTFSSATLDITTTNQLPVSMDTIAFDIVDKANNQVIKSVTIYNLGAGAEVMTSCHLSDITTSNQIKVVARKFSSTGSYPDKVDIDLSKGIAFQFRLHDITVIAGEAKITQQQVFHKTERLDITGQDERLYNIAVSQGRLNYTIHSDLGTTASADVRFPASSKNGQILEKQISIPAKSQLTDTWDFSNASFDLTTDSVKKYNILPAEISLTVNPTTTLIPFDSSNKVTVTFQLNKLKLASADGYLGKKTFQIKENGFSFDLGFLGNLKGSLTFDTPKLSLHYKNEFGVPIKAKVNFKAFKHNSGDERTLNYDSVTFKYPLIAGEHVFGDINLTKSNSSIVDFLSLLPDSISYEGGFITNPNGLETNHVSQNDEFLANAELQIPLDFQSTGITYDDTVTDVRISAEDIPAQSGTIYAGVSNGLPFTVSIQLMFPDSITGQVLRTLDLGTINAAVVSNNGSVNTPTNNLLKVAIPDGFLDDVEKANTMIVHLNASTYQKGSVPVRVFSDDKIKLYLGFSAELKP